MKEAAGSSAAGRGADPGCSPGGSYFGWVITLEWSSMILREVEGEERRSYYKVGKVVQNELK
jgi:hypothetical protein